MKNGIKIYKPRLIMAHVQYTRVSSTFSYKYLCKGGLIRDLFYDKIKNHIIKPSSCQKEETKQDQFFATSIFVQRTLF